jgi:hypothetical protein
MSKPFVVALLAVAGCVPSAEAGGEASTPYSCEGLVAKRQIARVDGALITPWRELAEAPVIDTFWVARVQAQSSVALPAAITTEERVRLQYQMLRVAEHIDNYRHTYPWSAWRTTHESVLAAIHKVAPTAFELDALGAGAHPQVSAILGDNITERATKTCAEGNSIHARNFHGSLAFRPLRAGSTRALVSQIVAFDTEGKPHITPLVEGMELRLGEDTSSPACVIQAADNGVLELAEREDIHEHAPFVVRRGDDGVGCNQCHRGPNTMRARDLNAFETIEIDRARDAQVHELANARWLRLTAQQ